LRVNAGYVPNQDETIDHITTGCPILTKREYLMRHDKACAHLHYSICKALNIETADKRYTHTHTYTVHTNPLKCVHDREADHCIDQPPNYTHDVSEHMLYQWR
jgi:hypothetical protein